jgi:drug/metabolite transporter superfamily protein YnfA
VQQQELVLFVVAAVAEVKGFWVELVQEKKIHLRFRS